jgi:opacity protein-like surface antigen
MTTFEFLSASIPWIFALRDRYGGRRRGSASGTSRMKNALALAVLGVLFALPTWAHHQYRHRPEPHRERPARHDMRALGGYVELESGVAALPDAVVHGPFVDGDLDLHPGFVTGGAIGAQLTPFLRLEGAMSYREAQVDNFFVQGFVSENDGSFGAFSTFANAYVDLAIPGSPVTPFIGGGVGVAVVSLDTYDPFEGVYIDDDSVQFAWNLSAGASWTLSEHIDFVTRYRYLATEDTDEDYKDGTLRFGEADVELDSHEAVLGIRFRF